MRFSLSALQFGKELLEVKSNAEEKQFGRDIGSPSHQEAPEVPHAGRWLHTPVHVHLLKYFRLLAGSAVDICRPFLYTVHVVSGSLKFQFTTKNEIGNPFWGSLSHFFVGAILQQPLVARSSYPTQKLPRLPVTETGAVCYALFVLSQALTQLLAGVLDRSLGGCQNYRAFGFTIIRHLKIFS